MTFFKKAQRKNQKLRLLLRGPSGSGKTFSALTLATSISNKVAFVDTEHGSSELYSDRFEFDMINYSETFGENYNPRSIVKCIQEAEQAGYEVLIIDSLSHFWDGPGGILEIVEKAGGKFQDWKIGSKLYKEFVESILASKLHIISCTRTKTEYEVVKEGEKTRVNKVGTKAVQREGLDYEFTTVLDLHKGGWCTPDKDRTSIIPIEGCQVDSSLADSFIQWLNDGLPIEFYELSEYLAVLKKVTVQEFHQSICEKYKVESIQQLVPDHIDNAIATMKATKEEVQKQAEEVKNKKVEKQKASEKAKMIQEIESVFEPYSSKMGGDPKEVKLSLLQKYEVDSLEDLTTEQLQTNLETMKAALTQ